MPQKTYGTGPEAIRGYVAGSFTDILDYPVWQVRDTKSDGAITVFGHKHEEIQDKRKYPRLITGLQFKELVDWIVSQGRSVTCL
jgi:hypothetical protein